MIGNRQKLRRKPRSVSNFPASRIENQTRYLMDYEIVALARSLKVSVGWLFGEEA